MIDDRDEVQVHLRVYTFGEKDGSSYYQEALEILKDHGVEPAIREDGIGHYFGFAQPVRHDSDSRWRLYHRLESLGYEIFLENMCVGCGSSEDLKHARGSDGLPVAVCGDCLDAAAIGARTQDELLRELAGMEDLEQLLEKDGQSSESLRDFVTGARWALGWAASVGDRPPPSLELASDLDGVPGLDELIERRLREEGLDE